MKFKMYHVILIVIILVVVGGLIYLRCLKKLEKPVVLYESEESTEEEKNDTEENEKKEENIDIPVYPGIPTIDGETVKNGEIIKPSKIIKETFANYVDLEYFASGFQEGVNEYARRFYESQSFIGDSVWHGLYSEYVASSTLKSSEDKYNVMNLDDLLTSSCWSEGKKGDGVGETIEIETFGTSEKVEWSNDENEINRDYTKIEDVEEYLKTHAIYDKPEGRFVTEEDMKSFRNEIYKVAIINGYANDDVLWKNIIELKS